MRNSLRPERLKLSAVLLAAGGSSRLGRPKQLLRAGIEPLIVRAARLGLGAVDGRVVIVLGAEQLRLRSVLRRHGLTADIVINRLWSQGMASSLAAGLGRVAPGDLGALILLVDQIEVGRGDLRRLVGRWRRWPGHAAAARSNGRVGAPAIIPRRLFRRAAMQSGDAGARHLLRSLGALTAVTMPAASADIDTPEDAAALAIGRPRRSGLIPGLRRATVSRN